MASLTLTDTWFHDASDLTDNVNLGATRLSEVPASVAPVRRYAGGRFVLVTVPGIQKQYRLSFPAPTRTIVDTLRDWSGQLLLYRDTFGRKMYGRFNAPTFTEKVGLASTVVADVSVTFTEVTHTEEV
jgi:hypothetical protein